jgi:hypothetical protein
MPNGRSPGAARTPSEASARVLRALDGSPGPKAVDDPGNAVPDPAAVGI